MASCTRDRVAADTSPRPLSTFDTVAFDTPATRATVSSVGRSPRIHPKLFRSVLRCQPVIDAVRQRHYCLGHPKHRRNCFETHGQDGAMRHTRLRAVTAAALAAATALTLAACGGASPGDSTDGSTSGSGNDGDSESAAGGEAGAWILTGGGWPVTAASFERWNEANADQRITVEEFENDAFKEKIRTSVGSGEAPTLIMNWTGGT